MMALRKEGTASPRADLALILRATDQELNRIAGEMHRDVIDYIEAHNLQVDGVLKKSVVWKVEWQKSHFTLQIGATAKYSYYVHEGRKPGKFPPKAPIVRWVRNKLNIRQGVENVAFLVRRKIAQQGTKGKPFIRAPWQEWQGKIQSRLDSAVAQSLGV